MILLPRNNILSNGNWTHELTNVHSKMIKSTHGIFRFASKLGDLRIKDMVDIYKARCVAIALYGAGVCGHTCSKILQQEENLFFKTPFKFTNSASIEITHQEVGLDYLSVWIAMHPLLLWRSIWAKDETKFTQTVIKDCLLLDKSLCIPWLKYIIDLYSDLFKLPIHDDPGQVINISKQEIHLWPTKKSSA